MAFRINLNIDQGSTFSNTIVLSQNTDPAVPLPANTQIVGSLRDYYTDPDVDNTISFTCSAANTTVNNQVFIALTIGLSANQTANLTSQNYVWDVGFLYANGNFTRIREGYIFVDAGVSEVTPPTNGVNTSVLYDLKNFTYDTANGTFIFGEYIFQTANGVTSQNIVYTYNTAIATVTSVNSSVLGVDTIMGTWQANTLFKGATSNATANLNSISYQ